jgi:small subunit ribosomal protein S25e
MGGKKKLSLKQMERSQDKKGDEEEKKGKDKKEKVGAPREKKPLSILPPDARSDKILGEVKKMGVLTPFSVATRFGVRISAAKDFLDDLEETGKIHRVSGNHNIKIYKAD